MNASKKRKPGRPATGQIPARSIRLPVELSARIDSWAVKQPDTPSRSEAIRRLVELGLAKTKPLANATAVGRLANKAVSKSSELAGKTIDRLSDQSAPFEEQEKRKRRLLKGPRISAKFAISQATGGRAVKARTSARRQLGTVDLRTLDRHPGAAISSLIPSVSCRRCSPNAPFAKLEMLTAERPDGWLA